MHFCKGSVDTASAAIALIAFLHLPLSQLQYGLIATGCSATMVNTQAWRQCMAKRTHQKVIRSFVFLFFRILHVLYPPQYSIQIQIEIQKLHFWV